MRTTVILGFALCALSSATAQWGRSVSGNGNVVSMERSTGDYEAISVAGSFHVDLVSGTEGKLRVKADENLQEYIVTEVKDGTLVIKTKNGVNLRPSKWKDGMHITVPVSSIEGISLSGSGEITGKTKLEATDFNTSMSGSGDMTLEVEAEFVKANMSGSGDIRLSGYAKRLEVQISGSGDIKAFDLEAEEVDASISGSADIEVTAKALLKARVSGSGDIRYRGNPTKIDTKVSGSGDISEG